MARSLGSINVYHRLCISLPSSARLPYRVRRLSACWNTQAITVAGSWGEGGKPNLARYKHTLVDENYLRVWPNVCWCLRAKCGSLSPIRFRMREAIEFDPHGRRKMHNNARSRGETCTKERGIYCI